MHEKVSTGPVEEKSRTLLPTSFLTGNVTSAGTWEPLFSWTGIPRRLTTQFKRGFHLSTAVRVIIMQVQNVLGFDLAGGNYPVGVTLLNDTFLGRFSEPSDAGLLLTERATSGSVFFNTVGAQGVLGSFNVEMVDRDRGNPGGGIQRGAVPPARPLKHRPGCPVCLWAILVQRVRSPSWSL